VAARDQVTGASRHGGFRRAGLVGGGVGGSDSRLRVDSGVLGADSGSRSQGGMCSSGGYRMEEGEFEWRRLTSGANTYSAPSP